MPYGKTEAKFLGPGKELTNEPCYKKLKSTAEAYAFPRRGSADFLQEDKTQTTNLRKPLHNENRDVIESVGSQILRDGKPALVSTDDGIYSTSKAFIGPIYKPPEKKKCNERQNETDTHNGINGKGRQEKKRKFNTKKLEIDTELSQFYKEIEELENEKDNLEVSCQESEPSQKQLIPYYEGHNNDVLKSDEASEDLNSAPQSHCGYQQYLGSEPDKYTYDGQAMPTFCDASFTPFRPEWESVHPFIVPYGPPLPNFNYHLNIQRFSAPPNPSPNIFHAEGDCQMQNGYDVGGCRVNWNCLTFDQRSEYTDYWENSSSVYPPRNGCSVQDGYVSNGLRDIREGSWKEPPVDKHDGMDRFMNQQFQEEKLNKLQKLLILLRGLPGSGKTTLSRILLGQSRDGIVFSTDDYFHHQDGYRYNVNQLGDAHDWNQNRAKQAIDQGRSPVIIDNTNTQAWEMKPYVEMAIGKGYRVEFHEPETWWKFDPEELEKRNKHGVSRKKIAQMLDRYEYQMSISIVMNSVEPTQKSTQRLPPPQGSQRERVLKKAGHSILSQTKQKRNRKRNKKHKSLSEVMVKNSFEALNYLTPEDEDPVPSEKEDFEETKGESVCPSTSGLQNEREDFVNGYKENSWKNLDPEDSFPDVVPTAELDSSSKNSFPREDDDLSSTPNVSRLAGTQNLSCVTRNDCSGVKVEKRRGNRHHLTVDSHDLLAETPRSFRKKRDKSLSNEPVPCYQRTSRTADVLREEQEDKTKNNYWAFFSTNSSNEELQLGPDRQPYFGSWPEGTHTFVCEQRPKKDRSRKLTCPDSREQMIKLISTSEGASGPGSSPEISIEKKQLIEIEDLSSSPETTDSFIETEANISRSPLLQLDIPEGASEPTENDEKIQKRIFNLTLNFNSLEQSNIHAKERERCGLLTENCELSSILGKNDKISEINNEEEIKQKVSAFNHQPLWFSLAVIRDSPLNIGGQFYPHYLSLNRPGPTLYFYKYPVPSLALHYISSFWLVLFTNKKTCLTFKSQTRLGNKLNDGGFISSEILGGRQPPAWCSQFNDKLKRQEDSKPLQCFPTKDRQDLISTDFNFLGLPLSQGFAFQLGNVFGSPGVPMESLLPDDCVIPLDWKTLKMIFLQWKMSAEKKTEDDTS
ncbi:PREDICTED: NEDD4-binding protein 2-like 2 [Chinchilla lanigera]|uniref:NEDD4-binding protein 2-like 2 n=1 Tax=Chinchilla lanigera TaxID=34839 RepID=UPI00038ED8B4|nr:PREDICTED: NEDD4-binding protein 2-like 2 [Chinchilla lanigera]XP_013371332.1 PREDICTED: NEDD4-binding protein 2-like 2 [Chinchilla lanigera]